MRRTRLFSAIAVIMLLCGCRDAVHRSSSMAPTIQPGERVNVDYTAYAVATPRRWDVVVFEPPKLTNDTFAMRIVALPGETVSFASNGIAINGTLLVPPRNLTNVTYVSLDHPALFSPPTSITSPYVVPQESYFVLGDNSTTAYDSRFWGAVPRRNIVGRVRDK